MKKNTITNKIQFDVWSIFLLLSLFVLQLFFLNGFYLFVGLSLLVLVVYHLQIPYKPTIFSLLFIYHLFQIMSGVWLSNFLNKDINYRSEFLGDATLYSYLGLLMMMLPVLYFQKRIPSFDFKKIKNYSEKISIQRTFELYVVMFFIVNLLDVLAFRFSGLTQIIVSIKNFKWFFFTLFGLQVILKRKMIEHFVIVFFLEFALGFFSYFSDFKIVFFYSILIALFFLVRINIKQIIFCVILGIGLFYLGVKWTAVKGEYRSFLNQGSKSQEIVVDKNAAFNKLLELSDNQSDFNVSAAQFFDRVQYTYHLAKTMERVPSVIPYQQGSNWATIIGYVLTPRFINPDKEVNQPSAKATKYTGIAYLGIQSGVSFSLGYFADCYIDFGYWGMLLPLLILGLIYGKSYHYFATQSTPNYLINFAFVTSLFMELIPFESDGTYLAGRLLSNLLTFYLFKVFLFPSVYNYLVKKN